MAYVNACAKNQAGERFLTKKALREAMSSEPGEVLFEKTSFFNGSGVIRGDEIPADIILSVVGPDAWKDRKWYATVQRTAEGKVTFK